MIVKFHVMKKGEMYNVTSVSDLQPFVKSYAKKYIQDVGGEELEKTKINATECYGCTMSGVDAGRIAKSIGLKPGHHDKGMWFLSKSKYKAALNYIESSSKQVESNKMSPKPSKSLQNRRNNQLLAVNNG